MLLGGSGLCLYVQAAVKSHFAFNAKAVAAARRWRPKKTDENRQKAHVRQGSSICLLTSSLVYQRRASERQRGPGPGAVEPSVVSHFRSTAGEQRVGEMGATTDRRKGGRGGGKGERD